MMSPFRAHELKKLIASGELNKALGSLFTRFEQSGLHGLYNQVVRLSARLEKSQQNLRSGEITQEEHNQEVNEITSSLLDFIDINTEQINFYPQNESLKEIISNHSSKIKDVYLELDNYKFFHSPYGSDKEDKRFIGRRKIVNHLKTLLAESETKSGAYLITGFRGMGKTSVVRKAIQELNKRHRRESKVSKNQKQENERTDKPWIIILGIISGLALLYFILIQFLPFSRPVAVLVPKTGTSKLLDIPTDILVRLLYCVATWLITYPLLALIFESIFFPKKRKLKVPPHSNPLRSIYHKIVLVKLIFLDKWQEDS